jgi:[1-hydroxy-2-(trimethylamino)ethyl]phosphonate dioxygenase
MSKSTVEEIQWLFETRGPRLYLGEPITELEHALQCALMAESAGEAPAVITAALLHDVGHLIDARAEALLAANVDARHEETGAAFLSSRFGPAVSEPVRLHVAAKAYLCRAEPAYWDQLSPASQRSLQMQGGIMTQGDAAAFIDKPYARDAVKVRRWDDLAKEVGRRTPSLAHFLAVAESVSTRSGT